LSLLHQEKPKCGRREVVISPEEYEQILTYVRNDEFRVLLQVAWETGARPQDLLRAQGRHLDIPQRRLVFQTQESKDKSHPRILYFTDAAWELLGKRIVAKGTQHLFTNTDGLPWETDAVNCAFSALHRRMNKSGVTFRRYCLYHFRHSWLDRMLKAGVDALTCAILMGHKDPSQLARTYQHLSRSPDYLRAALNKQKCDAPSTPPFPSPDTLQ
jgi:integrase